MSTRDLQNEMDAAKILRSQIEALVEDDPDFLADAIEGETNLFEQIDALVISVRTDEAMGAGIGSLIERLKGRQETIEKRADLKRSLIASALEIAGIRRRETPAGTVTLKSVPPKVIVTSEADIPSDFWKPSDPKLDKKAIVDRLKARAKAFLELDEVEDADERQRARVLIDQQFPAVPGATLGNGGQTIQIRG